MTTQMLRTIDRWRFETPLAVALAGSAAFFALTVPAQLFEQVPVVGPMGTAGRAIVAVLLAAVSGGVGYVAMRRTAKPAAPVEVVDPVDEIPEEERPSGMPAERFRRFRRADAHPDAPPREPIIASRDLGEPFMEVGASAAAEPAAEHGDTWWPDTSIPEADFTEVAEEHVVAPVTAEDIPATAPIAEETASVEAEAPAETAPASEAPSEWPLPRTGTSISAMMERLSAGLERRATADAPPARDMQPALRDALQELNRLAERRD
jgi:hypothetical protein